MRQQEVFSLAHFERDYRPALMAFFLRRLGNRTEAEDLTQDVYIRLVETDLSSVVRPDAYIFKIAANLLRDRARRRQVRESFMHDEQASISTVDGLDPHRIAAARESLGLLNETIAKLPERTRQIFLLFRYEQMDRASIAASFGISVSAVEKHIYRAMAQLVRATEERS